MKQRIISVLGWSNTGKTTFIERAIGECKKRGIKTAAIKKSYHQPSYPAKGKDSSRYIKAGALQSLFISTQTYINETCTSSSGIQPLPPLTPETIECWALSQIRGAEIIFCEGLRPQHSLAILTCADAKKESELKFPVQDVDFLLTNSSELIQKAQEYAKKVFSPDYPELFIEYIIGIKD